MRLETGVLVVKTKFYITILLSVVATFLTFDYSLSLAQETAEIRGQVVNGTAGIDIPGDLSVLMLITDADGQLSGTGQTSPDSAGRFAFENVLVQDGATYTVSVDYQGVFYGTSMFSDSLADELLLTIYETTRDASVIEVERQVIVIATVDKSEQLASAIEFVRIVNPSDRTLVPDLTNMDQISFLRFALPPNPAELSVQSDLPGGDIVSIGTGFALTSPVVPGAHSIDFSYVFPYESETVSYRQSLVQGADIFQILIPETFPDIAVSGLSTVEPVNIQGTSYRAYEIRDIPKGQGLQIEITRMPLPDVWTKFLNSIMSSGFWQIAIPSALGAALTFMLLWGLTRGYQRDYGSTDQYATSSHAADTTERAVIIRRIVELDLKFQEGAIPEQDYSSRREELLDQVINPIGIRKKPAEE